MGRRGLAQWWAYDGVARIHPIEADGAGVPRNVGSEPGTADFPVAVAGPRPAVLTRPAACISCFSFFGRVDEGERTPLLPSTQGIGLVQVGPMV